MPAKSRTKMIPQWIHDALLDAKAQDIAVLDVRKISDFTDTMIIATGTSTRHVVSVVTRLRDKLREQGVRAVGTEGEKVGDWVLIDFGDAVVHIMRPPIRDFYNLEKLWGDAKHIEPVVVKKKSTAKKPRAPRKKKK